MAKHKLLAGLLLSGAAFAAYHALSLEQRESLKEAARDKGNALKDRAVDYAFYAADALDDFKESMNDRLADQADADDYQSDEDQATSAADDDIVLSSDEVADLNDAADQADAADDEATTDKPEA